MGGEKCGHNSGRSKQATHPTNFFLCCWSIDFRVYKTFIQRLKRYANFRFRFIAKISSKERKYEIPPWKREMRKNRCSTLIRHPRQAGKLSTHTVGESWRQAIGWFGLGGIISSIDRRMDEWRPIGHSVRGMLDWGARDVSPSPQFTELLREFIRSVELVRGIGLKNDDNHHVCGTKRCEICKVF